MFGLWKTLSPAGARLADKGIAVSLFIDPDRRQLDAAAAVGAPVVELHTGTCCDAAGASIRRELKRLEAMEKILQVNADASLVDQIFEPTFDVPLVELIKGTDAALSRIMVWQSVAFAKYRLRST